eukprot:TRINITY_DN7178_c0_g1_i2.p1 TRINITY_DN7178_c0_g1~~TRINITY_DN7178_c0_g1_i2.p1  ORF type:complete len:257 (-),score=-1.70 TRINITY_DN7178_c0_g1_i2:191-961(-)
MLSLIAITHTPGIKIIIMICTEIHIQTILTLANHVTDPHFVNRTAVTLTVILTILQLVTAMDTTIVAHATLICVIIPFALMDKELIDIRDKVITNVTILISVYEIRTMTDIIDLMIITVRVILLNLLIDILDPLIIGAIITNSMVVVHMIFIHVIMLKSVITVQRLIDTPDRLMTSAIPTKDLFTIEILIKVWSDTEIVTKMWKCEIEILTEMSTCDTHIYSPQGRAINTLRQVQRLRRQTTKKFMIDLVTIAQHP